MQRGDSQVPRWALSRVRTVIDGIDDALLLLLAARAAMVRRASQLKSVAQLPSRDPERERRVHARAQSLARRIGLPAQTAREVIAVAIATRAVSRGSRLTWINARPQVATASSRPCRLTDLHILRADGYGCCRLRHGWPRC